MTQRNARYRARRVAEVRERYSRAQGVGCPDEVLDQITRQTVFTGTRAECQAWIDAQTASAVIESLRTPTRAMYSAMGDAIVQGGLSTVYHHDHVAEVVWSAGIAAAIRHIVGDA